MTYRPQPPRSRPPTRRGAGRTGLLALVGLLLCGYLIAGLAVNAFVYVYSRLGITPGWMIAILFGCLLGSAVDIPVARLRGRLSVPPRVPVGAFPWLARPPRRAQIIVLVNVGGALIPAMVSTYVIVHERLGPRVLVAVLLVAGIVHLVARPVPGVGVVSPALVPPAVAALAAVLLGGPSPAAVAFVAGTLGTVLGADLLNLPALRRAGAQVVSIGGAGTFDGVFLAGIGAVLLATI